MKAASTCTQHQVGTARGGLCVPDAHMVHLFGSALHCRYLCSDMFVRDRGVFISLLVM